MPDTTTLTRHAGTWPDGTRRGLCWSCGGRHNIPDPAHAGWTMECDHCGPDGLTPDPAKPLFAKITAQEVIATFAAADGEITFDMASGVASNLNATGGNLANAHMTAWLGGNHLLGWHITEYGRLLGASAEAV